VLAWTLVIAGSIVAIIAGANLVNRAHPPDTDPHALMTSYHATVSIPMPQPRLVWAPARIRHWERDLDQLLSHGGLLYTGLNWRRRGDRLEVSDRFDLEPQWDRARGRMANPHAGDAIRQLEDLAEAELSFVDRDHRQPGEAPVPLRDVRVRAREVR
jgi:hypothetical protein